MKKILYLSVILFIIIVPLTVFSQVSLPKVLGDNMVLQQGKKVTIWGNAAPAENVVVKFQKQNKKTKADENGNWSVQLDELNATNKPQQLIVQGKNNKILLKNILIGEVWLVSGQSNMEYSMNNHPQFAKPKKGDPDYLYKKYKSAKEPTIRVLYVEKNLNTDTLPSKGWQMIDEETLKPVSAIGYFFAKTLVDSLNVPVGFISTSWGGTPIETWTPEEAYQNSAVFRSKVVDNKLNNVVIGERFHKMVRPMVPYSLRGFLWYQGETNVIEGDRGNYADKKKLFIESWRSAWNDNNLPFYYVQLAPFAYSQQRDLLPKTWDALPNVWEAQTSCMSISRTGMVVTTDLVDNPRDIHPSYKWIIADRLARWALVKDYGWRNLVYCGPIYKTMTISEDKVILEFDYTGSGLTTNNGKDPDWFYMKNEKGVFVKVNATIENDKIVILRGNNKNVPVEIRFGWDEIAMPNLINKEGLPASPFRTSK
ncbi:sialate O-acetylesterase [Bacteroides reticulotermitis]|nr:sialate O-acetylesterase [Bacteroides reticulotermitis]MBB4045782.1 sialate O-acetylesterase [Bacteroides reticulotermitis]